MKNKSLLKLLTLAISLCIILSSITVISVIAADVWNGSDVSTSLKGAGTQADPYVISSADDFAYFASESRGGSNYEGQYIELDEDISLNDVSISPLGGFNGTFDGKGHEISGINITASSANQGFFTAINAGTVKNLTLTGSVSSTGTTVGGFAGYANSATLINCVNNLNVTGNSETGGFFGKVSSGTVKMINCVNNGNIKATTSGGYSRNGGFVGYVLSGATTIISLSENTGYVYSPSYSVVGGFVAQCQGTLTVNNCINSGKIEGTTQIGGIVANVAGAPAVTVRNVINVGEIKTVRSIGAASCIGGILGYNNIASLSTSETYENAFYRASDYNYNGANADSSNDTPKGTAKNTASEWTDGTITELLGSAFEQGASYPELACRALPGSGTKSDPYLISNMSHLMLFSVLTNNSVNFNGDIVNLTADIEIDDNSILPMGNFQGLFDGKGYEISGINISSSSNNVGFFASITNGGRVRNLTLEGSITSTGSAVGGFAGYVSTVGFINCVNNIDVTGLRTTGGFCGQVSSGTANFTHCINNGNITATAAGPDYSNNGGFIGAIITGSTANISLSENKGHVYSPSFSVVGGFVAQCQGTLTINNCINSGKIEGTTQIGGIVANVAGAPSVTVKNVINVGELKTVRSTGQASCIGGILGYNNSGALSKAEKYENAFYRDSDYNYNGANADPSNDTPKGTAKNTASEWTDGTVVELLGSVFEQGDYYPILAKPHLEGNGTVDSPYLITSVADFQDINALVCGGDSLEDLYFRLTTNLVLNENAENYEDWKTTAPANEWEPIGKQGKPFAGNLDGAGHTISGMYIDDETVPAAAGQERGHGLFGATYRGTIKNLHIKDSYVAAYRVVGGFTGMAQESTFENCSFEGYVFGYNTNTSGGSAGGFIGAANISNTFVKCYTAGTIDSVGRSAGLVGAATANGTNKIYDCYSTMTVTGLGVKESYGSGTGGLVGIVQNGTIVVENSFFAGSYPTGTNKGPIIGQMAGSVEDNNCYYLGEADGLYGEPLSAEEFADGTALGLLQGERTERVWIQGDLIPVFTMLGDLNFDAVIDVADAIIVLRDVENIETVVDFACADVDYDGEITINDYVIIKTMALNGIYVENTVIDVAAWSDFA